MALYKLIKDSLTGEVTMAKKSCPNNLEIFFAIDSDASGNQDAVEYKEWLSAGNTPEAAD
tara:strand:+ start:129 stop:308 length:180 start_codon:yes stop_codon:yes gene_type:complete